MFSYYLKSWAIGFFPLFALTYLIMFLPMVLIGLCFLAILILVPMTLGSFVIDEYRSRKKERELDGSGG